MKSMGFKDGWEYFWSYYKVPVFVIIGVIAFVISITMSVIRNSRPFIVQDHVYNNYLSDYTDVEYIVFVLSLDLATGDYIDVRLMLPSGQNYIVVAKKEVTIPNIAGADSEDTVWLNLREDEILSISSAIVDAARINGAKLNVTKYTEAGMQKAATPTYVVSSETAALMNKDPNILDKAMKELKSRYENIGSTEIRNNYINRAIDNAGEEGETNLKTNMEESITKSQENRKKYLDSLSGAVQ